MLSNSIREKKRESIPFFRSFLDFLDSSSPPRYGLRMPVLLAYLLNFNLRGVFDYNILCLEAPEFDAEGAVVGNLSICAKICFLEWNKNKNLDTLGVIFFRKVFPYSVLESVFCKIVC